MNCIPLIICTDACLKITLTLAVLVGRCAEKTKEHLNDESTSLIGDATPIPQTMSTDMPTKKKV